MLKYLLLLVGAGALVAADDPWDKVRALKSGTEVRIFKKGAGPAVIAKFDEASAESLIVVVKKEQLAIPKEQIERIDYRPPQPGGRVTKETKSSTEVPDTRPKPPGSSTAGPQSSTSSNVSIGSKPDFETIYRRTAAPQKN
jgi:hypothetical protein